MEIIRNFLDRLSARRKENRRKSLEKRAQELYDVRFNNNELWLCYGDNLVVPFSLITKNSDLSDCSALVTVIRKMYVERNV